MAYKPNFSDPRVLSRIRTAYGFARGCLSDKPRNWSQNALDKNLGRVNTDLGKWLRDQLLTCTNNHYSMTEGKTKEYVLNKTGAENIKRILLGEDIEQSGTYSPPLSSYLSMQQVPGVPKADTFDYLAVKSWAVREYGSQLKSGNFEYSDSSDRLWNPIQNIRSQFRAPLLSEFGFGYDYDIQACAPTLILQYAQQNGMDEYLFALNTYLKDRKSVRSRLAALANITDKQAKLLINALFCGARLGANRDYSLFYVLDQDHQKVRTLQADPFLTELRSDIKKCWDAIEPTLPKVTITSPTTGRERKVPLNSKRKWACYFRLERRVMDVVTSHLKANQNECFVEHDGWRSKRRVDISALQSEVRAKTGFNVQFESKS